MSVIKAVRGVQYPLIAEAVINFNDTTVCVDGVTRAFNAASTIADLINLPPNAVVIGGDVTVDTAFSDTGTSTIAVGDSASAARYLGATSLKAAGRTALVPTGYRGVGENVRLTFANANGDGTAGKVSVRVTYIITGRVQEVQTT